MDWRYTEDLMTYEVDEMKWAWRRVGYLRSSVQLGENKLLGTGNSPYYLSISILPQVMVLLCSVLKLYLNRLQSRSYLVIGQS